MRSRIDIWIGVAAIAVSSITGFAVIWQAKVAADQREASVWPYVQAFAERSSAPPMFRISLINAGVGPALIRYFSVRVDGKPVLSWKAFLGAVSEDETVRESRFGEGVVKGSGWVMTPNHPVYAFQTRLPEAVNALVPPTWSRINVAYCYCSIFKQCWVSEWNVSAQDEPREVKSCPTEGNFGVPASELEVRLVEVPAETAPP